MSRINKWVLDDENEIDFEDAEAVNQTDGELNDTIITYDGNTSDVQSWTDFISSFVNGTKVGKWFKNFRAGVEFLLHVGSLVNNCVTDNSDLPLSAAQGKVLMDLYTELNDNLTELDNDISALDSSYIYKMPSTTDCPLTKYSDATEYVDQMSNYTFEVCLVGDYAVPYTWSIYLCMRGTSLNATVVVFRNSNTVYVNTKSAGTWSGWAQL